MDDRNLKRAKMDYEPDVEIIECFDDFLKITLWKNCPIKLPEKWNQFSQKCPFYKKLLLIY